MVQIQILLIYLNLLNILHFCKIFVTISEMENSVEKAEERLNAGTRAKDDLVILLAPHANMIQKVRT